MFVITSGSEKGNIDNDKLNELLQTNPLLLNVTNKQLRTKSFTVTQDISNEEAINVWQELKKVGINSKVFANLPTNDKLDKEVYEAKVNTNTAKLAKEKAPHTYGALKNIYNPIVNLYLSHKLVLNIFLSVICIILISTSFYLSHVPTQSKRHLENYFDEMISADFSEKVFNLADFDFKNIRGYMIVKSGKEEEFEYKYGYLIDNDNPTFDFYNSKVSNEIRESNCKLNSMFDDLPNFKLGDLTIFSGMEFLEKEGIYKFGDVLTKETIEKLVTFQKDPIKFTSGAYALMAYSVNYWRSLRLGIENIPSFAVTDDSVKYAKEVCYSDYEYKKLIKHLREWLVINSGEKKNFPFKTIRNAFIYDIDLISNGIKKNIRLKFIVEKSKFGYKLVKVDDF